MCTPGPRHRVLLRHENVNDFGIVADEVDAIGAKRYESQSGGEREIQRTMLELLNQMDGFDARGDVKVGLRPLLLPYADCDLAVTDRGLPLANPFKPFCENVRACPF